MSLQTLSRKKGLVLDSNILTVYVVGLYDVKRIPEFKRTKGFYTIDNFYVLQEFIALFDNRLVTTPHILSEVSNLLEGSRYQYGPLLNTLAEYMTTAEEIYVSSNETVQHHPLLFSRFGLSDIVTGELAKQGYVVLTDDLDFSAYLRNCGLAVVNFNNLRFDMLY